MPCLLLSVPLAAQEPSVTLHETVSGNREQPKVMYILPWQQPGDIRFEQDFSAGLAGDLFVPQDRDEFLQQLNYQTQLDAAQQIGGREATDNFLNSD
ncbi:MAG: hypothetical protein R3E64_05165 [Halioglobus sp.]